MYSPSITSAYLRVMAQLITGAPQTPSSFLRLDLNVAKPGAGWRGYYACLPSVTTISPSQRAKAALE